MQILSIRRFEGRDLMEQTGAKIGKIDRVVFATDETAADDRDSLALIRLGLLGTSWHLVPLADAYESDGGVVVPYTKEFVKQAPAVAVEGDLPPDDLAALRRYYDAGNPAADSAG